jgi:hypothetical protein
VLAGGPAPDARSQQAVDLVTAWVGRGASRLDRDLDGKIDTLARLCSISPGTRSPRPCCGVLGDLAAPGGLLGQLQQRDDSPRTSNGSAYDDGWYGYVEKDLRSLLGSR